jgi:hypothetical protein
MIRVFEMALIALDQNRVAAPNHREMVWTTVSNWYAASIAALIVCIGAFSSTSLLSSAKPVIDKASPSHRQLGQLAARDAETHWISSTQILVGREASGVETSDTWNTQLADPAFWSAQRSGNTKNSTGRSESAVRSGLTKAGVDTNFKGSAHSPSKIKRPVNNASDEDGDEDGSSNSSSSNKTYRTLCVRLCDGYFWPISFSTTDDKFERDQKTCERSCEGPVRLFTYQNPGSDIEDMEDLKGQPYKKMPNAYVFRSSFEPSCKCKPHPWEPEAQDRHRLMALEAKRKTIDQQAAIELKDLKLKVSSATNVARTNAAAALVALDAKTKSSTKNKSVAKGEQNKLVTVAILSETANKPSIAASDGVVIMRLGASRNGSNRSDAKQSKLPATKQAGASFRRNHSDQN